MLVPVVQLERSWFMPFTGPVGFDTLQGESSGTVPVYIAKAEGPLRSPAYFLSDRHQQYPAELKLLRYET